MKPSLRSILLYLFLVNTAFAFSQSSQLRKAGSLFDRGEYYASLQIYNQLVKDGYELDIPTRIKTGHCYYNLNNIERAFEIFAELEDRLSGFDLFIYASTTHKFGFYSGAIALYKKARPQMTGKQGHIDEMIRACEWAERNQTFTSQYLINPLNITTFGQSFGIQFFNNGIVYSSKSPEKDSKQKDRQGMDFLSLYYSDFKDGEVAGTRLFSKNLVFPYHVGAIAFTTDFKTMFYTRVVRVRGGNNILKVFSVNYDGNEWVNEQELGINSNNFDNAHPAVSPDNKFLYFTSNRPGGYGGKDLYVVEIKGNGIYGTPRNLGPRINTFGDEQYPFVSKDNLLYFSSDGHIGFGGLDLFKAEYKNGEWTNVENMRQPFNSNKDDFGYVINPNNSKQGFLSSNRTSDGSIDAIFYVQPREEEPPKPEPVKPLSDHKVDLTIYPRSFNSMLTSTFNGDFVAGGEIIINDAFTGATVVKGISGHDGKVSLKIPDNYRKEGQEFEIIVSKGDGFQTKRLIVNIMEIEDIGKGGIALTPIFSDTGLNELSNMVIPFIGNSITPEGYKVLDKLSAFLINNRHVVIKLNGLTDARGNRLNNLSTSQSVAEKAEEYLKTKGVSDDNIIPRGYGERYLTNSCGRGKLCTEEEHLENRRINVVVWRFIK